MSKASVISRKALAPGDNVLAKRPSVQNGSSGPPSSRSPDRKSRSTLLGDDGVCRRLFHRPAECAVLLVGMEETNAGLSDLSSLLQGEGYQVEFSDEFQHAVEQISANPALFSAIFLSMTAYNLERDDWLRSKLMRLRSARCQAPVIVVCSADAEGQLNWRSCVDVGAADCIKPPFYIQDVWTRVSPWIEADFQRKHAQALQTQLDSLSQEVAEVRQHNDDLRAKNEDLLDNVRDRELERKRHVERIGDLESQVSELRTIGGQQKLENEVESLRRANERLDYLLQMANTKVEFSKEQQANVEKTMMDKMVDIKAKLDAGRIEIAKQKAEILGQRAEIGRLTAQLELYQQDQTDGIALRSSTDALGKAKSPLGLMAPRSSSSQLLDAHFSVAVAGAAQAPFSGPREERRTLTSLDLVGKQPEMKRSNSDHRRSLDETAARALQLHLQQQMAVATTEYSMHTAVPVTLRTGTSAPPDRSSFLPKMSDSLPDVGGRQDSSRVAFAPELSPKSLGALESPGSLSGPRRPSTPGPSSARPLAPLDAPVGERSLELRPRSASHSGALGVNTPGPQQSGAPSSVGVNSAGGGNERVSEIRSRSPTARSSSARSLGEPSGGPPPGRMSPLATGNAGTSMRDIAKPRVQVSGPQLHTLVVGELDSTSSFDGKRRRSISEAVSAEVQKFLSKFQ